MIDKKIEKKYIKNGWVKLESLINTQEINYLKKDINTFLKKNQKKYENRNINFISNNNTNYISSFHRLSDSKKIKKFSKQKKIVNIVKKLFKNKPKFRKCELFAKPAKFGIAVPDHQDNYYWCLKNGKSLTVWIALEDSSKKNGAVHYYQGSHKFGIVSHKPSFVKGSSQTISDKKILKKYKKIIPVLKKGDALVHDSFIIHGSKKNFSSKSRMGLTIQFQEQKCKYDYKRKRAYEKSLKNQIEKRNYARF